MVSDSLPAVDPNWLGQIFVSLDAEIRGRAWLARGPAQHAIGATAMLFFQNSDEPYPVFSQPSLSPTGASLHVSKVPRTVTVAEPSAIFCVEIAATVPASMKMFEAAMMEQPDLEAAEPTIDVARAARDTIVGAFALYQYPLIWRYLDDHFKVQYDDELFKRAKRVRDALSHGSGYPPDELRLMEHYIREIARYLLKRDLEFKGIFLDGKSKSQAELPVIVPYFGRRGDEQTASFGPI